MVETGTATDLLRWIPLLPLLGAAYSRACESTCDRHGLACSGSPEGAARALAALSAGAERWQQLNVATYVDQEFLDEGGLLVFGPSRIAAYRHAADYVHRILQGARPADNAGG